MSVECIYQQTMVLSDDETRKIKLTTPLYYNNRNAQAVRIVCLNDDSTPADLTGMTCDATFLRPDRFTVYITGTIDGNQADVVLPQSCYLSVGRFKLTVQLNETGGGGVRTAVCIEGFVERNITDTIVDPSHVIPSIAEVIAKVEACDEATEAANEAAEYAMGTATGRVRYDEVQDLSDDEKQQARDNIQVEATALVPILSTDEDFVSGFVSARAPGDTSVTMDTSGDVPIPAVTSAANNKVLRRGTTAGDKFTIVATDRADRNYACMFVSAEGDILGHYTAPKAAPACITAPDNSAWLVLNVWPAATGTANRVWIGQSTADRVSELESRATDDETAIGNRVRYDAAQTLNDTQKTQARSNIGAVDSDAVASAVADEAALRQSGDADTLASAKSYADGGDATALAGAKSYADSLVTDVVRTSSQSFSDEQKAQARTNIGAVGSSDVPTGVVRYDEAQTLTDAQKRQTQENIEVDPASAVRFDPSTSGYIRVENASTATSVAMENGEPVITASPESSTQKFRYSLIEVTAGDMYTIVAAGFGTASCGAYILAADGTILDRVYGTSPYQRLVWKMPSNAKWLYCAVNVASSGYGRSNRFYTGGFDGLRIDRLEDEVDTLQTAVTAATTFVDTVSGTAPSITAIVNHRYKCTGTVTSISITPCDTGKCEVVFTTGSNPTWDSATGAIMPSGFSGLSSNTHYEMIFSDGYGTVMAWPT